ncbi:hypothetical protein IGI04_007993 [Brassica rapa subsp. trilocularis]|uniref:Uncharacterized protein n=1 Tax=Brassica rapa subsp. trilocularis TaxID=1813537 RepID=A0ABQ7NPM0_BRACM|nr:hypothetical protein IGI04_007993 [Brassica rapa subsp. trilocularis]
MASKAISMFLLSLVLLCMTLNLSEMHRWQTYRPQRPQKLSLLCLTHARYQKNVMPPIAQAGKLYA